MNDRSTKLRRGLLVEYDAFEIKPLLTGHTQQPEGRKIAFLFKNCRRHLLLIEVDKPISRDDANQKAKKIATGYIYPCYFFHISVANDSMKKGTIPPER